jgi:hypothetical protein
MPTGQPERQAETGRQPVSQPPSRQTGREPERGWVRIHDADLPVASGSVCRQRGMAMEAEDDGIAQDYQDAFLRMQ